MLGLDVEFLKELTAEIKRQVEETNPTAMAEKFDAYLVDGNINIPSWQRRRVEIFIRTVLKG